ncbi:MAG: hypothetical protein H0X05_03180 [Actinobacteria bacterium]|nr:hypothetical protein [Actinomycetota bacterium]
MRELFGSTVAGSGLVVATGSVGAAVDSTGVDGVFRVDFTLATLVTNRFVAATLSVDVSVAAVAAFFAAIFVASRLSQLLTVVCGTS